MYFYVQIREKGNLLRKAMRDNGKILVCKNNDKALNYVKNQGENITHKIVNLLYHPSHKRSRIYGKKVIIKE